MTHVQICSGFVWKQKNTPHGGNMHNQTEIACVRQLIYLLKTKQQQKKTLLKFNTKSYPTMEFYESVKNNPTGSIKALIKFSKYLQ